MHLLQTMNAIAEISKTLSEIQVGYMSGKKWLFKKSMEKDILCMESR